MPPPRREVEQALTTLLAVRQRPTMLDRRLALSDELVELTDASARARAYCLRG
jgi:hypothetical protein